MRSVSSVLIALLPFVCDLRGASAQPTAAAAMIEQRRAVPEIGPIDFGRGMGSRIVPLDVPIADAYETSAGTLYLLVYHGSDFTGVSLSSYEMARVDGLDVSYVHVSTRQIVSAQFLQKSRARAIVEIGTLSPESTMRDEYWTLDSVGLHFIGEKKPHGAEKATAPLARDECAFLRDANDGLELDSDVRGVKSIISTSDEVTRATSRLASRKGIYTGCKRVGSTYVAWIYTNNAIDEGITYYVAADGSLRPLFRSYPLVVTEHYLLFAQQKTTEQGVSRYLIVRTTQSG